VSGDPLEPTEAQAQIMAEYRGEEYSDFQHAAIRIAAEIQGAIRAFGIADGRSVQSRAGIIGPSDLGFCRQKANLMLEGVEQSDAKPIWAAQVGTAIHLYVKAALTESHPEWTLDSEKVTCTFPSGAVISGTPDIMGVVSVVGPGWYAVLDIKTKDGLAEPIKFGPSQNHRYQRTAYCAGAIQCGLVPDGYQVLVGNVYVDRSGADERVIVDVEEWNDALLLEVDDWLTDVIYARTHHEEASRDVAAPVCEVICEYFTVCRGNLPMGDAEPIRDEHLRRALAMYADGKRLKNDGTAMQESAKAMLQGINGTDGEWTVRWIEMPETQVAGFTKAGYKRIDVRRAR
jgi:hypothetical protein